MRSTDLHGVCRLDRLPAALAVVQNVHLLPARNNLQLGSGTHKAVAALRKQWGNQMETVESKKLQWRSWWSGPHKAVAAL